MKDKYKTVQQYAMDDISKTLPVSNNPEDRWHVSSSEIFSKKSRKLNKDLDLHKVNKNKIKTFEEFKMITKYEKFNEQNGYETIASTTKYGLVKIHNTYRVENYKGMYKKEVPYVEIPKSLAEIFSDYLLGWKEEEKEYKKEAKADGIRQFNLECDEMFDEEHTELYPDSVK